MYKRVSKTDIEVLMRLTDPSRVVDHSRLSSDYSHDELGDLHRMPEVLVRVMTTQEVSDIMAYAWENSIPVVVRGSGTGLVGGSVAMEGGIMLETLGMNRIVELDDWNLTVTVQPGVLLMDLAAFVMERGFLYPPDPGEKSATIGGNISTNAGGMRAVKYGVTRDYVRALTVVLPNGKVLHLGGKTVKNSTGYSLLHLLVGSEGTLGIITEATLKLIPLPERSVSLLVPFDTMEAAIRAVPHLIRGRTTLTAIEYFELATVKFAEKYLGQRFPDTGSSTYLLLTVDGSDKNYVEKGIADTAELCISKGAKDVFLVDTQERQESVWKPRGAFLEAIKASTTEMDECDVVVPRSRIVDFILYIRETSIALGLRIPFFGHVGDGNLHIYICRDEMSDAEWKIALDKAFERMYRKAAELDGQVSGEHGIGYAKKKYMRDSLGGAQIALMQGIKKVFDSKNILNPGKLF